MFSSLKENKGKLEYIYSYGPKNRDSSNSEQFFHWRQLIKARQNTNWNWIAHKVGKNYWVMIWEHGILGLSIIYDPKEADERLSSTFHIVAELIEQKCWSLRLSVAGTVTKPPSGFGILKDCTREKEVGQSLNNCSSTSNHLGGWENPNHWKTSKIIWDS